MTLAELERDVVILACAISAGIHGALAPDHFSEGEGAGIGFVAAAAALAGLVVWLTARPEGRHAPALAAAALLGLLAGYAVAVTSGLTLLHPVPEAIDGLALGTKAVEAFGLLAASSLLRRRRAASTLLQPKGTLT